jgi:hypothetical protein
MRIDEAMPSINLYVPDDLKARMDRAGDGVNWSSVAQAAFARELASHRTLEEPKMTAVLERLKASKAELVDSVAAAGFVAGKAWAETAADYLTLKRIGEYDWSGFDEDVAIEFERIARVDPETFWANHPKEARPERNSEDFIDARIPPVPPVPPHPPNVGPSGAAEIRRVARRTARRAHAAATRALRGARDIARPSAYYVEGFAKGAASVWREVKDAL